MIPAPFCRIRFGHRTYYYPQMGLSDTGFVQVWLVDAQVLLHPLSGEVRAYEPTEPWALDRWIGRGAGGTELFENDRVAYAGRLWYLNWNPERLAYGLFPLDGSADDFQPLTPARLGTCQLIQRPDEVDMPPPPEPRTPDCFTPEPQPHFAMS